MKTNLKFLNIFILIFIISLIIDAFEKIYSIIHYLFDHNSKLKINDIAHSSEWNNLTIITYLISSSILILFIAYLAVIFRKVITSFSKSKYFSSKNVKQLSKVGKGLIIYGIIAFFLDSISEFPLAEFSSYNFGYTLGKSLAKSIPIFIISSFILLIASIIRKGNILQQENDLTI